MKQYIWTGEQRMLPGIGAPKEGDTIELPEDQGASLAAQGLCKEVSVSKAKQPAPKEE